jgi:hypothetical protein
MFSKRSALGRVELALDGHSYMPTVSGERRVREEQSKVCFFYFDPSRRLSPLLVMREEIITGMQLLGVTSLDQLKPEMVRYVDRDPAHVPPNPRFQTPRKFKPITE